MNSGGADTAVQEKDKPPHGGSDQCLVVRRKPPRTIFLVTSKTKLLGKCRLYSWTVP
jgi:hypothetical protein